MPVRRRQPRRQETGAAERYREMGIAAALARPWNYPTACGELASLLRLGYAKLPKAAQALVAADVLLAFRLLPDVQTGYAVTAANSLLQAVEAALPKQKKAQAVSEFKRSVVAHKRRARVQQETCSPHIPQDVLVHIFSFLDMRSLVAAGLVCWSWSSAANDNNLWRINYSQFFGVCHVNGISIPVSGVSGVQNSSDLAVQNSMGSLSIDPNFCWKELFHKKYAGNCAIPLVENTLVQTTCYNFQDSPLQHGRIMNSECATWRFASNRALCGHCRSVIWLSDLACGSPHHCSNKNVKDGVKLQSLLPDTVAEYILQDGDLAASSSESDNEDSDSDEYEHRRFWIL